MSRQNYFSFKVPSSISGNNNNTIVDDFHGGSDHGESACSAGDPNLIPGSGRFPGRRECLPTPVFLPGEFHRQKILASYSPWVANVRHL